LDFLKYWPNSLGFNRLIIKIWRHIREKNQIPDKEMFDMFGRTLLTKEKCLKWLKRVLSRKDLIGLIQLNRLTPPS